MTRSQKRKLGPFQRLTRKRRATSKDPANTSTLQVAPLSDVPEKQKNDIPANKKRAEVNYISERLRLVTLVTFFKSPIREEGATKSLWFILRSSELGESTEVETRDDTGNNEANEDAKSTVSSIDALLNVIEDDVMDSESEEELPEAKRSVVFLFDVVSVIN